MQYRRAIILIFLILTAVSCAHDMNVRHEVVKPDGAPFPDPYYMIQTVDPARPIRMSFFYEATKYIRDLDGKKVPLVSYLDRREHHYFMAGFEDSVKLVVRVSNPMNVRYKILIRQDISYRDGGQMNAVSQVAYSDMKYRQYDRQLPILEGIKEANYSVDLVNEKGERMLSTGAIHYYVSQNNSVKN